MCGISGYSGEGGNEEKLRLMTTAIIRRGPDDSGFYLDKKIGLGFRRLSIIDLNTGHQPISNEDETVWVILNGEIYNYKKLRSSLIDLGHQFKTESDTETIVHAYEEWGLESFKKLEGMFAIALWDSKESELFLVRDIMGKKPLYWTEQNKTLWFASEIKSFISANIFKKEIDMDSLGLYFTEDYIPTPKTIFKNIYKLEPATILRYKNGIINKSVFWNYKESETNLDEKETVDELKKKIDEAVLKRLASDVPLGVFLSGGLDSSVIAESAGRLKPGTEAFSLGFEDSSYDETENAKKIATAFGLKHHIEKLTKDQSLEILEEAVNLLDEPLADPSILPTLLLSKFTKNKVTVVLSGDGGDELLLGYQHIPAHNLTEKINFIPTILLKTISLFLEKIPSGNGYFSLGFKVNRLARGLQIKNRLERDTAWRGSFQKKDFEKIIKPEILTKTNLNKGLEITNKYAGEVKDPNSWRAWSFAYLRGYLMDDVMVKVDRGTMWYGLEARAPLLDQNVASFILNLPDKYKLGKWKNKKLFKKILENKLPEEIINAPKHGFGVPVGEWLKGPLYKKLMDLSTEEFLEKQNIFNRDEIIKLIESHKNGSSDRRKELWAYLMFQLWYTKWI